MSQLSIFQQQDFSGGLNLRSDQFQLGDNESPKMLNVEIDPRGGVFSRGGMHRINSTPISYTGSWSPQKLTPFYGTTPHIMLTSATTVYKSTGSDFSVLQYSANGLLPAAGNITTSNVHGACLASWGSTLYIATGKNGANAYRWSTANACATPLNVSGSGSWQNYNSGPTGHMPKAEHIIVHAGKMFAANTNEDGVNHPNRIRWSHEFVPDSWLQLDYIDINGGGDGITGMFVVGGQMMIFKPNAIYILYGTDSTTFKIVQLSGNLGCQDHHMMAQSDSGLYFYSLGRGLYFTDGNSITDLFRPLRPIIDLGYTSSSSVEGVSVSWVGGRIWLSLPYSTTGSLPIEPTINFVFDPSLAAYTMFQTADSYGVVGGCDFRNANNTAFRLMVHPTQPYVLNVDRYESSVDIIDGTDSGFASYYRTKWFDGGSYMQKKMFRRPDIVLKEADSNQSVNVKVYHDFDENEFNWKRQFNLTQSPPASSAWGTALWGTGLWSSGVSSSMIKTGRNLGLARTIQLEFTGQAGQAWGINSIGYKYNSRRVDA